MSSSVTAYVTKECRYTNCVSWQVKVYMGDGWHLDFKQTHFDLYSPPDFYTRVRWSINQMINQLICNSTQNQLMYDFIA